MAHKLFNVVADMDSMTSDQLKGAIRNMETVGNMLHTLFRTMVKEETENSEVLGLDWDRMKDFIDELYLPSVDGRTVIVSKQRPTSLLMWQLEFFNAYGNLKLDVDFDTNPTLKVHLNVSDDNFGTLEEAGWVKYNTVRKERERSDAALYESMSKIKRP